VAVRAMGRGEDVAIVHGLADADGYRLLPDRDVQEPRQVARAEPLLDLLLEVTNEEHVAEKVTQRLLGDSLFLLDLGHDRRQCTFCAVSLVGEWRALQAGLPDSWVQASLQLDVRDPEAVSRVAALLGPAAPYRAAPTVLRFNSARDGTAQGPDAIARLLRRIDDARVVATLVVLGSEKPIPRSEREVASLVESWDAMQAALPEDWSDLFAEARLGSSDYVERAAVLCIQMNPRRVGTQAAFRFRSARRAGYGVAPEMARRCFERCAAEEIRGTVAVLRVLSDTQLEATQGPVWILDGQTI
jgi:hypothetical protein